MGNENRPAIGRAKNVKTRKKGQLQFPFARRELTAREIREMVRTKMDAHQTFEVRHAARKAKREASNRKMAARMRQRRKAIAARKAKGAAN